MNILEKWSNQNYKNRKFFGNIAVDISVPGEKDFESARNLVFNITYEEMESVVSNIVHFTNGKYLGDTVKERVIQRLKEKVGPNLSFLCDDIHIDIEVDLGEKISAVIKSIGGRGFTDLATTLSKINTLDTI